MHFFSELQLLLPFYFKLFLYDCSDSYLKKKYEVDTLLLTNVNNYNIIYYIYQLYNIVPTIGLLSLIHFYNIYLDSDRSSW